MGWFSDLYQSVDNAFGGSYESPSSIAAYDPSYASDMSSINNNAANYRS